MADLTRPNFGEAWASEGEKLSPGEAKLKLGWVQEMMTYQYENYLQARQDEAILYLLQKGVPEYSATQEYTANKSVVVYQGNLYMATSTVTGVLPTVPASWKRISPTVGANGAVSISSGGTGATTAAEARTNLGLGTASTANLPTTNGVVVRSASNTLISRLLTGTSGNISVTNPDGVAGNINIDVGTNVAQLDKDSSWTSRGGITLPKGSSSERGVEVPGKIRYNTELQKFEGFDGTSWNALGAASEVEITTLSGDGITTSFTLTAPAFSETSTDVYIGGVWQNKGTYNVSGSTITFSEAPTPGTDNIQVVSRRVVDLGAATATQVSIQDTSNYYTATTVEGALREIGEDFSKLTSYTGTISADAEWSDVPAHSDPAFDVQTQALANRSVFLRESSFVNKDAAPAFLKTVSDIVNFEPVNILRFIPNSEAWRIRDGVSDFDCTSAFDEFLNSVNVGYINYGLFNIPRTVVIDREAGLVVFGSGAATRIVGNHDGVAGGRIFQIKSGDVDFSDILIESVSAEKRAIAVAIEAQGGNISDYKFSRIFSKNNFYAIRATSLDGGVSRVKDVSISNLFSVAPAGTVNSGHLMLQYVDDVAVINSHTRGGYNTSAFGFTKDTRGILVTGCTEKGVIHSGNYVEASLQIEESPAANAHISGNNFGTDIWVSDSSSVTVVGNSCGRMRVTVGQASDTNGARKILFRGNSATGLRCTSYGVSPSSERIQAVFSDNVLDPERNAPGVANTMAIQLDGRYIDEVELIENKLISNATTNSITIVRGDNSKIILKENDFGSNPSFISGSGGVIIESNNKNPLYRSGNGGFLATVGTSIGSLTPDAWTNLVFNTKADINNEYDASGYFVAKVAGWYSAGGSISFSGILAGGSAGSRIVVSKGGTVSELSRGSLDTLATGGLKSCPVSEAKVYLEAGDKLAMQYYVAGSSSAIIPSGASSRLSIFMIS